MKLKERKKENKEEEGKKEGKNVPCIEKIRSFWASKFLERGNFTEYINLNMALTPPPTVNYSQLGISMIFD